MIGSLVNWKRRRWVKGDHYEVLGVYWGFVVDTDLSTPLKPPRCKVRWLNERPHPQSDWWVVNELTFVTRPVNDGGEGNVAEDIKRKT